MNRKTNGTTKKETKAKKQKQPKMTKQEIEQKYGNVKIPTGYKLVFNPLTEMQEVYFNTIMEKRVTICTGVAGSGKSFVCLSAALQLLKEDNGYNRILIITPTVEAGNMEMGFLKGSKDEKMQPYLDADFSTINDILEMSGNAPEVYMKQLAEKNMIQGDVVNFMRGKTIKNTIVIITEAENFNKQELFLLLSRMHPTSKYIINGDNRQQDRKDIRDSQKNGLAYAMQTLKGEIDEIGFCHFTRKDIVRDPLIGKIMDLWFGDEDMDEY